MVLDGFKWFKITLDPFSLFSGVQLLVLDCVKGVFGQAML